MKLPIKWKISSAVSLAMFFCFGAATPSLWAEMASSNYTLVAGKFTGGTVVSASATGGHKVEGGEVSSFAEKNLTGSTYSVSPTGGVAGIKAVLPKIESVSPGDMQIFYLNDPDPSFSVTATDPDGDPLTYTAKQSGVTKDGPQASGPLTWALTAADIGRHDIDLEVQDNDGTVVHKQSIYVMRRPIK